MITWILNVDENTSQNYGINFIKIQSYTKEIKGIILFLPFASAISKYLSEFLESKWIKTAIQKTLTQYSQLIFDSGENIPDENRATLFKYKKFKFFNTHPWSMSRHPFSGWLVPIARSGHTTQKVRSIFLAPDKATNAEGIAGLTWRTNQTVTLEELKKLTKDSTPEERLDYAQKSKSPIAWVNSRLDEGENIPVALQGIPIEVHNSLWGVIVLDSSDPKPFNARKSNKLSVLLSSTLTNLLERGRL